MELAGADRSASLFSPLFVIIVLRTSVGVGRAMFHFSAKTLSFREKLDIFSPHGLGKTHLQSQGVYLGRSCVIHIINWACTCPAATSLAGFTPLCSCTLIVITGTSGFLSMASLALTNSSSVMQVTAPGLCPLLRNNRQEFK